MWWIEGITCLCVLLLFSYIDVRFRKVPVCLLVITGVSVLIYQAVFGKTDLHLILFGAGMGILFLFISRITREGMGYGDSWGIVILGIYLGLWGLIEVLSVTFFMLALFSAAALCKKRMSVKCGIPFYPFLTGGYLVVFFMEGGL